jgi:arylsulfatase A-like enzyme
MTGNVDIMPTLIDLAGGKENIPPVVDGKSLLPLLLPSQRGAGLAATDVAWRDSFMVAYKSVGTYYNDHSGCSGNNMGCTGSMPRCTVRVFRQKVTLEDTIGSHACPHLFA